MKKHRFLAILAVALPALAALWGLVMMDAAGVMIEFESPRYPDDLSVEQMVEQLSKEQIATLAHDVIQKQHQLDTMWHEARASDYFAFYLVVVLMVALSLCVATSFWRERE